MKRRDDLSHYLTMLVLTAPSAGVVYYIFRNVYLDLSRSERAVGYVDPMMQTGITMGYYAMIGGTIALAAIALWSALQAIRLLFARKP
ncbi:MAG TPA: hypothetical protein VGX91_14415 [Candidatus Cybelea sp.]|nr:hypothetical protein [Candidatus Cybelea sp.]